MLNESVKFLKAFCSIFIAACICGGCIYMNSPQIPSNHLSKDMKNTIELSTNSKSNEMRSNNVAGNQNTSPKIPNESVYQKKSRRSKIIFPNDCQSIAGIENEYLLEKNCAKTLYNIQPDLPQTHVIGLLSEKSVEQNVPKINCDYVSRQNSDRHFDFDKYGAVFYPLSPNKYLVEVECVGGAYNTINVYLLYDESAIPAKAEILEFPSFRFEYDEDSDVAKKVEEVTVKTIGGRYFNPKIKQLIVFVKSRGIGDAGEYARYSFPNGKPKLEEFRAKFKWEGRGYQADDVIKNPPKTWRRYYPK